MKRLCALVLALMLIATTATAELRFAYWGDETATGQCALATERFSYAYPKSKAEWITLAYADREAYAAAWRGDPTGFADVMLLDTALLDELAGMQTMPLAEIEQLSKQLVLRDFSYLAFVALTLDDQLIAVPVSTSARLLYWNQSLVKVAGLKPPAQWSELAALGEAMQAYNGGYGIAADATARMSMLVVYLQSKHGRDWLDASGQCAFSADEIADGLRWLRQMERNHTLAPLSVQGDDALAAWRTGQYACVCLWDSDQHAVAASLPEGDQLETTAMPEGSPFDGNMQRVNIALGVSASCADLPAAGRFINYLLNEEIGQRALAGALGVPDNTTGLNTATGYRLIDADLIAATRTSHQTGRYIQPLSFERPALTQGAYRDAMLSTDSVEATAQRLLDAINAELR